jgi:LmbE family N-acetylglucosaminyl deacetylase
MTATKHILAIHAHPDDVEILCAGTLALLAAKGHRISIVSMTPGDCGSADRGPEEIAAVRREEARQSARQIQAEYRCAEFRDLSIFVTDSARRRVTGLLREVRPEIVLTSSPADYHCDHEATSTLVQDACFAAPAPNYASEGSDAPPLPAIPHLYFVDRIEAEENEPRDFFVDVSSIFPTKRAMLAEHRSQRDWLKKHHGIDDYLEQMERWCAQVGRRAGVQYAEGFRQCHRHSYPQTPALQELLAGHVRV